MVLPPEEQRLRGSGALKPVSCCFSSALSAAAEMNFTPPKTLRRAFEVGVHAVGLLLLIGFLVTQGEDIQLRA